MIHIKRAILDAGIASSVNSEKTAKNGLNGLQEQLYDDYVEKLQIIEKENIHLYGYIDGMVRQSLDPTLTLVSLVGLYFLIRAQYEADELGETWQ